MNQVGKILIDLLSLEKEYYLLSNENINKNEYSYFFKY